MYKSAAEQGYFDTLMTLGILKESAGEAAASEGVMAALKRLFGRVSRGARGAKGHVSNSYQGVKDTLGRASSGAKGHVSEGYQDVKDILGGRGYMDFSAPNLGKQPITKNIKNFVTGQPYLTRAGTPSSTPNLLARLNDLRKKNPAAFYTLMGGTGVAAGTHAVAPYAAYNALKNDEEVAV